MSPTHSGRPRGEVIVLRTDGNRGDGTDRLLLPRAESKAVWKWARGTRAPGGVSIRDETGEAPRAPCPRHSNCLKPLPSRPLTSHEGTFDMTQPSTATTARLEPGKTAFLFDLDGTLVD